MDAYAHCADRRDADGQKSLFTEDTHFVVYMDGEGTEPTQELSGREALTPVFADLNRYEATTHFNGQSTSRSRATGRPARATAWPIICLPRRRAQADGRFASVSRQIRQARRHVALRRAKLYVDWTETRDSLP